MGERARIARDLHDVVAHHVSAIAVQAESARLTTEGLPEEGRAHFEAIGRTARDALTEMRRLLGVLREDANAEAVRDPQPGLARLNDLVETARAAGTPVRSHSRARSPSCRPASTSARTASCRRRSRTYAGMRPARGRRRARVQRRRATPSRPRPRAWRRPAESDGHGLLGMRERAIMVGGTLSAGPADGGGFASRRSFRSREPRDDDPRVVVDDQEIVRAGFAALLGTQAGLRVVGTAADGEEAVEALPDGRPHVVLMDVRMPVMDGIEATRQVTADGKRPPR